MKFTLKIGNPFKGWGATKQHNVQYNNISSRILSRLYEFINSSGGNGSTTKYIESYGNNSLVYIVVNRLATNTSSLPRKVVDSNGDEINNSKLKEALESPNENQSEQEFYQDITENLVLSGNAFIRYIEGIGMGQELEVLDSEDVVILINTSGDVIGYAYTNNMGVRHTYDKDEVLHIRMSKNTSKHKEQKYWGLSPLNPLWDVVRSSRDLFEARASIWKNKGIIGIITNKSDTPLLPKEREQLQNKFDGDVGGASRANKMHVTSGDLAFIQTGMSPSDLKLLEGNIDNLRMLSSAYNLPSVIFNDTENSTYNNVREAKVAAYTDAYIPLAEKIDTKISLWLSEILGVEETIIVDTTRVELLKLTTNEVANRLNNLPTNVAARVMETVTRNEARQLIALDNVDGGDELLGKSNSKENDKDKEDN